MTKKKTILLPISHLATLNYKLLTSSTNSISSLFNFRLALSTDLSSKEHEFVHQFANCHAHLIEDQYKDIDFSRAKLLPSLLDGCEGLILSSGLNDTSLYTNEINLLNTAIDHKVTHFLKISGPTGITRSNSSVPVGKHHSLIEEKLRYHVNSHRDNCQATILRTNLTTDYFLFGRMFEMISSRTLSIPVQNGAVAYADAVDVSDAVMNAFEKSLEGNENLKEYNLTGPEALTYQQVVNLFSKHINAKVRYSYLPIWAMQPSMWLRGVRPEEIAHEIEMARATEANALSQVTQDLNELLQENPIDAKAGRRPKTLETFIIEHHNAWPLKSFT